jgi:hypothetical protein
MDTPDAPRARPVGDEPFALQSRPDLPLKGTAVISPCRRYRYKLTRGATHGHGIVNFVMLNPSTADADMDDPTVRRCIGFAREWGYYDLVVTNLFALRATDPRDLKLAADPIGPDNDAAIVEVASKANLVVCAWGAMGPLVSWSERALPPWDGLSRAAQVLGLIRGAGAKPFALKLTGTGQPAHPLYLKGDLEPFPLEARP